jgi:hypothetical protein
MTSTGFNVPYLYMYRKNLNHIHPPLSSSFTHPFLLLPSLQHAITSISIKFLSFTSNIGTDHNTTFIYPGEVNKNRE